jgi:hypothetical protein
MSGLEGGLCGLQREVYMIGRVSEWVRRCRVCGLESEVYIDRAGE